MCDLRWPVRDWIYALVTLAMHFIQRNQLPSSNLSVISSNFFSFCTVLNRWQESVFLTIEQTFFFAFLGLQERNRKWKFTGTKRRQISNVDSPNPTHTHHHTSTHTHVHTPTQRHTNAHKIYTYMHTYTQSHQRQNSRDKSNSYLSIMRSQWEISNTSFSCIFFKGAQVIEDTETNKQSLRLTVSVRSRCIQMIVINVISVSGRMINYIQVHYLAELLCI